MSALNLNGSTRQLLMAKALVNSLVNTAWLEWGGTTLIAALVFVETGFLLGLIVPGGETLLFTAGLLTDARTLSLCSPSSVC